MTKKPRAWSVSALKAYETCPKKYFHTSILKDFPEPHSEAIAWGSSVHKAFERRLKRGNHVEWPKGMERFEMLCSEIEAALAGGGKLLVEHKVTLDINRQVLDDYFHKDAWVRCVFDVAVLMRFVEKDDTFVPTLATILDWKTGKPNTDETQLELMALCAFAAWPSLELVKAGYVFVTTPGMPNHSVTYYRQDLMPLWADFLARVEPFESSWQKSEYPAKPSGLCRKHCPVKTCAYNGV